MYIDTHAHINSKFFNSKELDDEMKKIQSENVSLVINVGTNVSTSIENSHLSKTYSIMYYSIGIHPNNKYTQNDLEALKSTINDSDKKLIAIGETGLDFFHSPKETVFKEQMTSLEFQVNLAIENDLPLIIHARNSLDELLDFFTKKNNKKLRGVIHTFSGTYDQALKFIKLGFYISISGVVTFKNNLITKEVVQKIPLKYLLTETDSPFLAPVPFRGKTNHPYYLKYIIDEIAKLRNISINELTNAIRDNVKKLFGI